jgi:hypothetical protein
VTWFDQIAANGEWRTCQWYRGADDSEFFTPRGELNVRIDETACRLRSQQALGNALRHVQPSLHSDLLGSGASRESWMQVCRSTFEHELNLPVRMISFGPTENDKECF